jgi:hypothetical protein
MLPPLAELSDVADIAPDLTLDPDQVAALIRKASAIARAYARQDWVDEDNELDVVPDGVVEIVAGMVERVLRNPSGATQETTGPFSTSFGARAADRLFLTRDDKLVLRPGGAFTVTQGTEETAWLGPTW